MVVVYSRNDKIPSMNTRHNPDIFRGETFPSFEPGSRGEVLLEELRQTGIRLESLLTGSEERIYSYLAIQKSLHTSNDVVTTDSAKSIEPTHSTAPQSHLTTDIKRMNELSDGSNDAEREVLTSAKNPEKKLWHLLPWAGIVIIGILAGSRIYEKNIRQETAVVFSCRTDAKAESCLEPLPGIYAVGRDAQGIYIWEADTVTDSEGQGGIRYSTQAEVVSVSPLRRTEVVPVSETGNVCFVRSEEIEGVWTLLFNSQACEE